MNTPIILPLSLFSSSQGGLRAPLRSRFLAIALALAALAAAAREAAGQDFDTERRWTAIIGEDGRPLPPSGFAPPESPAFPQPNVGYGPLRLSSQSPFQSLRLGIPADPPSTLRRGHFEIRETTAWSKMWAKTDDYLLNFEVMTQTQSVVYGITDGAQLELGAVESTRFGGRLDGFVRGFHDALGIDQAGRDQYRHGEFHFQVRDKKSGSWITIEEDRGEVSAEYLFLTLHQTITGGSDWLPAVSISLSVKGSLQDSPDLSGDALETAGSVTLAKRFGDFYAYLSAGLAWYGDELFRGIDLRSMGTTFMAALEWNFTEGASVVLQQLRTSGVLMGYGDLSKPSYEISLGVKVEVDPGLIFEFAMIENIIVFDNSPDFGIHFGMTTRF